MPAKIITYNTEARAALKRGVDKLADAVKTTLGPRGRNVIFENQFGSPTSTKDGVTVAEQIELEDQFENLGAQLVKQVANKTVEEAGDGTTTATLLVQAIVREGMKNVTAGANPMDLKRGIEHAVGVITGELKKLSVPVGAFSKDDEEANKAAKDSIRNVGIISSNGDEAIGSLIADAMEHVGRDGIITVENSTSMETEIEYVAGLQFDRGLIAPGFINDYEEMQALYDGNPYILLHDGKINNYKDIIPILKLIFEAKEGVRPVLFIAEDYSPESKMLLLSNRLGNPQKGRPPMPICAVKAPAFGERRKQTLEDIAILTGGTVLGGEGGTSLASATLGHLGAAAKITSNQDFTTIVGGAGTEESVENRKKQLRMEIERSQSEYDAEKLQERLARLSSGVAVLKVGAATEVDMKEKKFRIEDALLATKAAVAEGIVPGGGVALIRAADRARHLFDTQGRTDDFVKGINIVCSACEEPLKIIVANGGGSPDVVLAKVRDGIETKEFDPFNDNYGYNAQTEVYEDLIRSGVIDPTKVVRCALANAASVASVLLMTETTIISKRELMPIIPQENL